MHVICYMCRGIECKNSCSGRCKPNIQWPEVRFDFCKDCKSTMMLSFKLQLFKEKVLNAGQDSSHQQPARKAG